MYVIAWVILLIVVVMYRRNTLRFMVGWIVGLFLILIGQAYFKGEHYFEIPDREIPTASSEGVRGEINDRMLKPEDPESRDKRHRENFDAID